jgi:type IV pilus assembly protein PilM
VVAAVMPRNVLEEYESAALEAGYNPGSVLPSMIAALGVVDATVPTMVIKVETGTTTFAIVDQNQLLLYRALENGGSVVTGESLVDDVNTSLVYFEDRYGIGVDRLLVTGVQSAQALQSAFGDGSNIKVEDLVSSSMAGIVPSTVSRAALAGVVGALVP